MLSIILRCCTIAALVQYSSAILGENMCEGCTIINGAGYKSHPTDCGKYIQCNLKGVGMVGEIRKCPFSTFWNNDIMTCVNPGAAKCLTDTCKKQEDGTMFADTSNCRQYWKCKGERSIPKCCQKGMMFDNGAECVKAGEGECTDTCFNDIPVPTVSPPSENCDKRKYSVLSCSMFEQKTPTGWEPMCCAPGTKYQQETCSCGGLTTNKPPVPGKEVCKAEVYLPFTKDHKDKSENQNYIKNEGVGVFNGVAKFYGTGSRLVIPRFTNFDVETIVIKIIYRSDHNTLDGSQAIISNADCNTEPSVIITESQESIVFGVRTSQTYENILPQHKVEDGELAPTKEIVYEFANGFLVSYDQYTNVSIPTAGKIASVHCALQIGQATGYKPFKGEIEEITIYLCKPE